MENNVKNRILFYINTTVKKFNSSDFDIKTNEGKVVSIKNGDVIVDKYSTGRVMFFLNLEDLKISTLNQIVEGLKCELKYNDIVEFLIKKNDYFDKEKKVWTYKPINRDLLMERIKFKLRNRKISRNSVRLSKKKD